MVNQWWMMILFFCDRDFFVHTRGREEEEVCPNSKGSSVLWEARNFWVQLK
jgi:hypothetical protein